MKRFNYTGTCIPEKHYMVDTSDKIKKIIKYIDYGDYFTINRPRQYGKTTSISLLERSLKDRYILISISFAGNGELIFETEERFCNNILSIFAEGIMYENVKFKEEIIKEDKECVTLKQISEAISRLIKNADEKVVLFIDEVDKSSNYSLFLSFLGMLRNKYLEAAKGKDYTFHSVVLAGVHDIKNIKMKIRGEEEISYNSPWNIAIDFEVNMSFSSEEISTILIDYEKEHNNGMDIKLISEKIYEYTSGYPYLVSKLCYIMDEKLDANFTETGLEEAIKIILNENNTLFDDLIKNLERYDDLYNFVKDILIENNSIDYVQTDRVIVLGSTYGILDKTRENKVKIHNRIFEILLLNHLTSEINRNERTISRYNFRDNFIDENGDLEFEKILIKFQEFMKGNYSGKDDKFYERQGRLLLIAFVKPIINGVGFYYVENQISYEKRTDMIVTYNKKEYVLELKIWYGEEAHQKGLNQLEKYLEIKNKDRGYLVIFNFNKGKEYKIDRLDINGKEIFEIIV